MIRDSWQVSEGVERGLDCSEDDLCGDERGEAEDGGEGGEGEGGEVGEERDGSEEIVQRG